MNGQFANLRLVVTHQVNIIDVGLGNTASMEDWLEARNIHCTTVQSPAEITANTIVLPGAGSAGTFMRRLRSSGFADEIIKLVKTDCKLIGICLGFQVMFERSEEDGGVECLGLLEGIVEKLKGSEPHNGWENFNLDKSTIDFNGKYWPANAVRRKKITGRVYYNHEYGIVTSSKNYQTIPINGLLRNYVGMLIYRNIIGMQFHPEKSQSTGKTILEFLVK